MYNAIVVGTDGSDTADLAVEHATELAKLTGATLHIVHAYQGLSKSMVGGTSASGGPRINVASVNAEIAAVADDVCAGALAAAERAGVKYESHLVPGDPADALDRRRGQGRR